MIIGVLKEPAPDKRVAILPEAVAALKQLGVEQIVVQRDAGVNAFSSNADYEAAGAVIAEEAALLADADLVVGIAGLSTEKLGLLKPGAVIIGLFDPLTNQRQVEALRHHDVTSFSLEIIPRTSRAQSMDVLSSMATAAGYRAVLMAAIQLPHFFPMFMTAAGTIPPAKVLVLGAGVAGLQTIATAKRLGAVVQAFDVRSAVKEEVESLGAKFIMVEGATEEIAAGGYAVEQTEAYKQKQQELIHEHALKADVVITTAQIPGKKAPVLIEERTAKAMKPGSVIVDMAAASGGNCPLTVPGEVREVGGVTLIGITSLAADLAMDSSKMFGKNVINFLKLIIKDNALHLNWEDDLVVGTCLTRNGEVVNERVRAQWNINGNSQTEDL